MNSPRTDRDRLPVEEPLRPEPDLTSGDLARRGREDLQASGSFGMLPLLLGVAAVVGLTLLIFTTDTPPNQGAQPPASQGTKPPTEAPATPPNTPK